MFAKNYYRQKADIIFTEDLVINKIYTIRDQKVMLDRDLADLYKIETKRLKEAVRRNIARFPDDFMFELTLTEFDILRTQFETSKKERGGNRYLPLVFTEYCVLMLSSVLNSETAIEVNIQIMRIFSKIRKALADTSELRVVIGELRRKTENNTKNQRCPNKKHKIFTIAYKHRVLSPSPLERGWGEVFFVKH